MTNNYSVPDLQFYLLAVNSDHTGTKLDSYCQVMDRLKSLIGELKKETRLSNSYIKSNITIFTAPVSRL